MTSLGYGPEVAPEMCEPGLGAAWYRAVITNVGGRGAWPFRCTIQAFDRSGKLMTADFLPLGLINFPAGPFVEPGKRVRLDWYLAGTSPETVQRLEGQCEATDYGGNPPV